jgi:hypothetical protein
MKYKLEIFEILIICFGWFIALNIQGLQNAGFFLVFLGIIILLITIILRCIGLK